MIYWIIRVIVWLIISEGLYLWCCIGETKKQIRKEWLGYKFISLFIGAIITFLISLVGYGIVYLYKNYPRETLLGILGIILIILFFIMNKYVGLSVAKKPKKKK